MRPSCNQSTVEPVIVNDSRNSPSMLGVLQRGNCVWRIITMWKQLKFTVSSDNLSLLGQSLLPGWNGVGSNRSAQVNAKGLELSRHEQDGWVDFYIGNAQNSDSQYRSVLDGSAKVGLHYQDSDLYDICAMACPSRDIPSYLWQSLQEQCKLLKF